MTALRLRDVTRFYGERPALRRLSLELSAGSTLAVFGANGAGKTTLLRILATLLRPHAGTVEVLGEPVPERGHAVRGRLGFLAHEPLLYRDLTGRENLRYHARLHRVRRERVEEVLDAVGLLGRADEPLRFLSRGMVQRMAIARAVLHAPELLLLDEPFAGLDPAQREALGPLLRAPGTTRVLISHDIEAGLAEADAVLGLRDGAAVLSAPAAEVGVRDLRELYR